MINTNIKEEAHMRIIASNKNWIDSEAIAQLDNTSKLEGIILSVGLPDLHPGRVYPIGAAFLSKGWIYPCLVGSDIGCGMGFWKTNLRVNKLNIDKWASKLIDLELPWDGDISSWAQKENIVTGGFNRLLGTIGGGNHFAELMALDTIIDTKMCNQIGIDQRIFYLLVHSGSRGIGQTILNSHMKLHGTKGLRDDSQDAQDYIDSHNKAVKWAQSNRKLIMERFLTCLGAKGNKILDVAHNTVATQNINGEDYWLHRKGATPATKGLVIIPGSRGDFSYLVMPIGRQDKNAYSLAHGAGRKWSRAFAKGKLKKYNSSSIVRTSFGSRVICEDKSLIYEEAPQAYKKIDMVIADTVNNGLIHVIAKFKPIITYKTREKK